MIDYIALLEADLEKGYSKSDLEKLIGLPKNNLSGILKGDRKLSKKSQLKIDKWEKSEKPDPLQVVFVKEKVKENNLPENKAKIEEDKKPSDTQDVSEIDARIAKIEEMLLAPPKFLPSHKRTSLESELNKLKIQLMRNK